MTHPPFEFHSLIAGMQTFGAERRLVFKYLPNTSQESSSEFFSQSSVREQLDNLKNQLNRSSPEQRERLELQVIALRECAEAAEEDRKHAARILEDIQALRQPYGHNLGEGFPVEVLEEKYGEGQSEYAPPPEEEQSRVAAVGEEAGASGRQRSTSPRPAPAASPDKWSAMVNSVGAFIGTIAKKIEYWQHQLAYHFAPLVEQLKKIKIPFLGIDFSSQIGAFEQFVGLDSIMISASLRKAGLVPVFNSEHPERDTEVICALTRIAEEAKKKNKNYTSQDFYDAVALRHADSLQRRGAEAQEPSGRKVIRLSELVPFAQTVIAGIPASSEQPAQPQRAAEATAAAVSPEGITFPEGISFAGFKEGVQIGPHRVKVAVPDRIEVGARKWKLEGKEGNAAGATMEITNVEWRNKQLQFEVKGTKLVLFISTSKTEKNVLSEEATTRFLNHLASSDDAYKVYKANGEYAGVDIVRV